MNNLMTQNRGILLESGTNEMELLTVRVGGQPFGINVAKVLSIQQFNPALVTALPQTGSGMMGMFLYRDRTIPLMDLAEILGIDANREDVREIVVVTEFNHTVNAFRVQGVDRIFRLSWEEFVPLEQMFNTQACFTGTVHVEENQILVLDLEQILAGFFPELILETVRDEVIENRETLSRESLRILFAEDSPTMRNGIVKVLEKAGFTRITTFENGEKAFRYLTNVIRPKGENSSTVLITDIEMPRMDGLTLCRKIKQDAVLKDVYVVMFSSLINDQMIAKCEKVLADNYVTKPETNDLVRMLDARCNPL